MNIFILLHLSIFSNLVFTYLFFFQDSNLSTEYFAFLCCTEYIIEYSVSECSKMDIALILMAVFLGQYTPW